MIGAAMLHRSLHLGLGLLAALLCGGGIRGQGLPTEVLLRDGQVLQGRIVRMDEDHLVLEQRGKRREIPMAAVARMRSGTAPGGPVTGPAPDPTPPPARSPAGQDPPEAGLVPSDNPALDHLLTGGGVMPWLQARYPWLSTATAKSRISLLVVLVLLLGLAIHFGSAVVAGIEDTSILRGMASGIVLVLVGILQLALPEMSAPVLALVLLGNGLFAFLLFQLVYQGGVIANLGILACLGLCGVAALGLLEMMTTLLPGNLMPTEASVPPR
jgi:hypothetical protein